MNLLGSDGLIGKNIIGEPVYWPPGHPMNLIQDAKRIVYHFRCPNCGSKRSGFEGCRDCGSIRQGEHMSAAECDRLDSLMTQAQRQLALERKITHAERNMPTSPLTPPE